MSATSPNPHASNPLLAAFAQNAALRLRCDRAFVSLLDNGTQRVAAEASQSSLLCGVASQVSAQAAFLDRMHSMAVFQSLIPSTHDPNNDIANQTRHAVRDVRLLTYGRSTQDFPSSIAYAAVPIRAASGRLLGIFCVIDNKTRQDFLSHETFTILHDISFAISRHVEPQTTQLYNDHDMQAKFNLSTFLEHDRPQPMRNDGLSGSPPSRLRSLSNAGLLTLPSATSSSTGRTSSHEPLDSTTLSETDTPMTTPGLADDISASYFADSPSEPTTSTSNRKMKRELQHESKDDDFPQAVRHRAQQTLASAADLIRAAHDLEGLVILNTAFSSSSSSNTFQESVDNKTPRLLSLCDKLEISVVASPNTPARIASSMSVEHESLEYLVSQFPQGCVLKLGEQGMTALIGMGTARTGPARYEQLDRKLVTIPSDLQALLEAARSLVFMPLWDSARQAFYAGILGWPVDPMRVFTENDLLSLSIYGRILTAEITHFDATETEVTKSEFVSSLSHELRSPLHGCLAAVEVMRDTKLEKPQSELLGMIESCASTLLYTMNHLLDYSKINNLDRAQASGRRKPFLGAEAQGSSPLERFGQTSEDYLCRVVQDVVEGVAYGYDREQAAHDKDMNDQRHHQQHTVRFDIEQDLATTDDVAVFLFMESRAAWFSMFSAGAWKRLVMNLFGNALKFCSSGHIEVTLQLMQDPKDPNRSLSHLMVRDTGIGMSDEFIKHSLYRPFSQANSLMSGTGLGLSIVKQIVDDMQGVIKIESTLGVGTQFDVFVPVLERESIPEGVALNGGQVLDPQALLSGLTLCLLTPQQHTKQDKTDAAFERTKLVHSYLKRIAENWFDMKIVYATSAEEVDADLYVVEALDYALSNSNRTILVGNRRQMVQVRSRSPHDFVELTYPLGPRALCRALHAVINKPKDQAFQVAMPLAVREPPLPVADDVTAPVNVPAAAAIHVPARIERSDSCSTAIAEEPLAKTEHLLLVDDNAINLKLLSTFVKKMGMDACTAVDGEDALMVYKAYAKRRPFTTILMDISMPKMNGFESTRAIRDYEAAHNLTPSRVIALTALGSEASRRKAEASGLDGFQMKPVSLKTLKGFFPSES